MPRELDRDGTQALIADGAQIIEVLPPQQYDWAHLPVAVNLFLDDMTAGAVARTVEAGRPIVLYCNDFQ